jgi:hypothetical protein
LNEPSIVETKSDIKTLLGSFAPVHQAHTCGEKKESTARVISKKPYSMDAGDLREEHLTYIPLYAYLVVLLPYAKFGV